jgi:phytoene/squalene synthetase
VSRSFAIVIEQLGDELRNAVCVFYLVLRGLDTVSSRLEPAPAPLPGMIWIQKPELDAG